MGILDILVLTLLLIGVLFLYAVIAAVSADKKAGNTAGMDSFKGFLTAAAVGAAWPLTALVALFKWVSSLFNKSDKKE